MTDIDREKILSRIIEIESENVRLIYEGHKSRVDDFFEPKRQELILLRCLYFGYGSNYCKIKK